MSCHVTTNESAGFFSSNFKRSLPEGKSERIEVRISSLNEDLELVSFLAEENPDSLVRRVRDVDGRIISEKSFVG